MEPQIAASLGLTLFTVWSASLVGSTHCLGMCGPIAAGTARGFSKAMAYNLGRALIYIAIGFGCGWLGEKVLGVEWEFLRSLSTVLMVGLVLFVSWRIASGKPFEAVLPKPWTRLQRSLFKKVFNAPRLGDKSRAFFSGVLTGFLPCGWLYTFAILAGASGSAVRGALILGAFWLGTLPMMLLAPSLAQKVIEPLRLRSPALTGALIAGTSLFAIWIKWAAVVEHSCH